MHRFRNEESHDFFYSELMLYVPWRDEESELHSEDLSLCMKKYHECIDIIEQNRKLLYPYGSDVQIMEDDLLHGQDFRNEQPIHLYENINPEYEMNEKEIDDSEKEHFDDLVMEHENIHYKEDDKTRKSISERYPENILHS